MIDSLGKPFQIACSVDLRGGVLQLPKMPMIAWLSLSLGVI
jgi:hypothetical protein